MHTSFALVVSRVAEPILLRQPIHHAVASLSARGNKSRTRFMQPKQNHGSGPARAKATASQILGAPARVGRIKPEWQGHYDLIEKFRDQLLRSRNGHADTAREETNAFSLHMADAGTDEFDRDFALTLMSSEQSALFEVEQALNRIRSGNYGMCELSGEAIEPERLAAIPWARFSAKAQAEMEANGSARRPRLAERGSLTESESASSESESDQEETPASSA